MPRKIDYTDTQPLSAQLALREGLAGSRDEIGFFQRDSLLVRGYTIEMVAEGTPFTRADVRFWIPAEDVAIAIAEARQRFPGYFVSSARQD